MLLHTSKTQRHPVLVPRPHPGAFPTLLNLSWEESSDLSAFPPSAGSQQGKAMGSDTASLCCVPQYPTLVSPGSLSAHWGAPVPPTIQLTHESKWLQGYVCFFLDPTDLLGLVTSLPASTPLRWQPYMSLCGPWVSTCPTKMHWACIQT